MEFEDMQKIWDAQNNRSLYVIDENALYNRIKSKMRSARNGLVVSEWGLMIIYFTTSAAMIGFNAVNARPNPFLYLAAVLMLAIVAFILINRRRRVRSELQFDRSMHGDLDQAISLHNYQMQLSQLLRWSFLPLGVVMILSGQSGGQWLKVGLIILLSYSLAFVVTTEGYRANRRKKRELLILKEKLKSA